MLASRLENHLSIVPLLLMEAKWKIMASIEKMKSKIIRQMKRLDTDLHRQPEVLPLKFSNKERFKLESNEKSKKTLASTKKKKLDTQLSESPIY